ncbi:hypothetical protein FA15DRAFT_741185 [Coprinopsis marcescibilis]|uniref:DUF6533 domain-containing protein n=1 Tax=Coprinopsis marcescibilis TaxID=230819 RepID=A0A5C3KUW4_COPMA|nr:hypothetical protein FA15DRAFT_741185 [Coprinopsis marcescibilis]
MDSVKMVSPKILEFVQTVDLEVTLIWPIKWNYIKAIFFINRYLPFFVVTSLIYYNVAPPISAYDCKILFSVPSMGVAVCILVADALLYVRLWAISGRTRIVKLFLIVNLTIVVSVCLVTFALYLYLGSFVPSPNPELVGCVGQSYGAGKYVMICYAALFYSAIVTMGLSLWYGMRLYRLSPHSRLIKILARDGSFYFVTIAALSIVNGMVAVLAPARYRFLLAVPQGVAHNILSTRMILHLRETARTEMGFGTSHEGQTVRPLSREFHATVPEDSRITESTLKGSRGTGTSGTVGSSFWEHELGAMPRGDKPPTRNERDSMVQEESRGALHECGERSV